MTKRKPIKKRRKNPTSAMLLVRAEHKRQRELVKHRHAMDKVRTGKLVRLKYPNGKYVTFILSAVPKEESDRATWMNYLTAEGVREAFRADCGIELTSEEYRP